ncbi:hypothetical protein [Nocardia nova]|uniref:hypothetical protein n=1 Tax=Nocardia nova TaxID=37330 RepID=UPI0033D0251D
MSEFTVPGDNPVEATGRSGRVATIDDVCYLAVRTASTSHAHSSRADLAALGAMPRPGRRPGGTAVIGHTARYDTVTAR